MVDKKTGRVAALVLFPDDVTCDEARRFLKAVMDLMRTGHEHDGVLEFAYVDEPCFDEIAEIGEFDMKFGPVVLYQP